MSTVIDSHFEKMIDQARGLPILIGDLDALPAVAIPPQQRLSSYRHFVEEGDYRYYQSPERIDDQFYIWHPWTVIQLDTSSYGTHSYHYIRKISWSTTDPRLHYSYMRPGLPNIHTDLSACSRYTKAEGDEWVQTFLIDYWQERWALDAHIHVNSPWIQHMWNRTHGEALSEFDISKLWGIGRSEFQYGHQDLLHAWEELDEDDFQLELDKAHAFSSQLRTTNFQFNEVDSWQRRKNFSVKYDGVG